MIALEAPKPSALAFVLCLVALHTPTAGEDPHPRERLPGQPLALQSRLAPVDLSRLASVRAEVGGGAAAKMPLNLFDEWPVVFERVAKTGSGYALSGRLAGHPLSSVTVVVNGEVVAGTVNSEEGTWHVQSRGAGVVEIRRSEGALRCGVDHAAPFARRQVAKAGAPNTARAKAAADQDDGDEIDVLVVFTEAARRYDGGLAQIRAIIDLAVAATNEAYLVSGARQRLNLVAAVQVDYRETTVLVGAGLRNLGEDLVRLADETDGYMDEVHALRDSYAADIVYLIRGLPRRCGERPSFEPGRSQPCCIRFCDQHHPELPPWFVPS